MTAYPDRFTTEFTAEFAELSQSSGEIAQALQTVQQMLEQGDDQAKYILDRLPTAVIVVEAPAGRTFYINQIARDIIADDGVVQLPLDDYEIYVADTGERCPVERRPLRRALCGETVYENQLEWHIGSNVMALEIWTRPVYDRSGNILFAISVFQDSTARKQAEKQLEATIVQQTELDRARTIQSGLFPQPLLLPGFELAACCYPSLAVGGDLYDYYWQDGDLALTLADVMGKGISAALLMAAFRAALRVAGHNLAPGAAITATAAALAVDLERAESYITAVHCQLNLAQRRLTYVNAGHGHGFLLRADGSIEPLVISSAPINPLFARLFQASGQVFQEQIFQEQEYLLAPSDRLILYSDGLIDARPELALTPHRIASLIQACPSAAATLDYLVGLSDRNAGAADDLTVLVLRCL